MVKWSHYGAILWCTGYPWSILLATILRKIGEDTLLLNQYFLVFLIEMSKIQILPLLLQPLRERERERERERLIGPINLWGPSIDICQKTKRKGGYQIKEVDTN